MGDMYDAPVKGMCIPQCNQPTLFIITIIIIINIILCNEGEWTFQK